MASRLRIDNQAINFGTNSKIPDDVQDGGKQRKTYMYTFKSLEVVLEMPTQKLHIIFLESY